MMASQSTAAEPVVPHAAGSLRFALNEVAGAFEQAMFILSADGQRVLAKYGFAAPTLPN
jgi:ABC-type molybdate transport system substrate-binding protein